MKKRIFVSLSALLLRGCNEAAVPDPDKRTEFLKDDYGFSYTEERLTAENSFSKIHPDIKNPSDSRPTNDQICAVKTKSREADSSLPIAFTIGVATKTDRIQYKTSDRISYLCCQIQLEGESENRRYTYKAATLPKLNEGDYHVLWIRLKETTYYIFNVYTTIQIDFAPFYPIIGNRSGSLSFQWLAPKETDSVDFDNLYNNNSIFHSEIRTYQFQFAENGKKVKLESD